MFSGLIADPILLRTLRKREYHVLISTGAGGVSAVLGARLTLPPTIAPAAISNLLRVDSLDDEAGDCLSKEDPFPWCVKIESLVA